MRSRDRSPDTVASDLPARRSSPSAVRSGGALALVARQARAELTKLLRAPDFVAPVVLLPAVVFVLFASSAIGDTTPEGIPVGPILTASFATYGALGVIVFTFGEAVASERGQGWLRLVRATPLPGWAFITGKLIAGIALIGVTTAVMGITGTALSSGVAPDHWVRLGLTLVLGSLALAPFGFLIGLLVRPSAAGAVALLLYLPLAYASGMWTPVQFLPEPVQAVAPFLPTFHLTSLAHASIGVPTSDVLYHSLWLAGTLAVSAGIAVWAYRRVAGRQFA
jgi:ABC-2 type transport system permease protein